MPIARRNSADTLVPITPPTLWNASSFLCIAAAAPAIAMEVSTTMLECPSEKKKPTE